MLTHILVAEWLRLQPERAYAEARVRDLEYQLTSQDFAGQAETVALLKRQRQKVADLALAVTETTQRLAESPEAHSYTARKQANLVNQVTEIVKQLSSENAHARLTPNQGLVFEDGLFGRIYGLLLTAIQGEVDTCELPFFHRSTASNFDETGLRTYLMSLKNELQRQQFTLFPELYAYLENAKKPLFALAPSPIRP